MEIFNADLHIHSPYAGGTSKNMSVEKIAEMSYYKGLQISPVGDLTHKKWFDDVFSKLQYEEEAYFFEANTIFGKKVTYFLLSTEVQLNDRSHHLVLFENKSKVLEFREAIKPFVKGLDGPLDGRPWLRIGSEKFAEICVNLGLLFGPAHAFTPYFGVYAHFDSLKKAYGKYFDDVAFLELGLSADSYIANNIEELKNITFLSNSDAHSFWPNKLGREFNRFLLKKPTYYEIEKALRKKDGRKVVLNVGLDPKEGKYHRSACNKCFKLYTLEQANALNWKCDCGGTIKKGVHDKIVELAKGKTLPYNRPEYKYVLPLAEIIAFALGTKNPFSKKVQDIWWDFIKKGNDEISILLDLDEEKLKEINPNLAKYILAFRKGYVVYKPGGGGQYGEPIITFSEEEKAKAQEQINQLFNHSLQRKLF